MDNEERQTKPLCSQEQVSRVIPKACIICGGDPDLCDWALHLGYECGEPRLGNKELPR